MPADHLLRKIDWFFDVYGMREKLRPFYSHTGRSWIDPELIVRILVIGYAMGIRSERRLCQDVHLNLAYRRFCRLGLDDKVPDHSTFSRYRHGKFRESGLLRQIFEATVERCLVEDLVSGEGFAVDASLIPADANKSRCVAAADWSPEVARRAGNRGGPSAFQLNRVLRKLREAGTVTFRDGFVAFDDDGGLIWRSDRLPAI